MPLPVVVPGAPVVPMHLGALHPVEQALTFALAFGPFVVLGVVVVLRRRQDALEATADPLDESDEQTARDRRTG